jgi:ribokinase/non-canonical purine NTP pyrophosphatase (RdgB/HAM1 family)
MVKAPLSFLFAFPQLKSILRSPQTIRSFSHLNMNTNSIIVVGSANVDLNAYTPTLPTKGETILGTEFKTSLGGKGSNQAIAAARISNTSQIHMIYKVGDDAYGQQLMQSFDQAGVRYSSNDVVQDGNHTGIAAITVDSAGENTIVVVPGSNHDLTSDDVKNQLDKILKSGDGSGSGSGSDSIIMTQLEIQHDVALTAMKIGRSAGALTILNPAPAPESLDAEFFDCVDIIIPNETELRKLVSNSEGKSNEELATELFAKGIRKAVIITLGEKGAMVVEKGSSNDVKVSLVSAPEELQNGDHAVVDTVGAGDSFCGSLAVYLQSGLGSIDAAVKACGVAGFSVRKMGAQNSYPTCHELPDCLRIRSDHAPLKSSKTTMTFVTGNKKKLEEVQRILSVDGGGLPFELTNRKLDLPELQGNDPAEIAIEKCKLAAEEIQGPVFTEDTSLCFNALNGMPGVYIKWFLEKCGHDGLNRMLDGFEDRSAYAQTIIAFTTGVGEEVHVFDGRTDGNIVEARGPLDFGW